MANYLLQADPDGNCCDCPDRTSPCDACTPSSPCPCCTLRYTATVRVYDDFNEFCNNESTPVIGYINNFCDDPLETNVIIGSCGVSCGGNWFQFFLFKNT